MAALELFDYNGQQVRTVLIDGEPYFVARDVLAVLGLQNPTEAMRGLDDDEFTTTEVVDSIGRSQAMFAVTEAGMYSLVLRSRKPEAKAFKRWITHEVLPAIRKTGAYAPAQPLTGAVLMAQALIEAHSTMATYQARVKELEPMAQSWEKLASATGDYSVRDAAQVLCRDGGIQIGQNRLFRYLREASRPWLDGNSRPYQWAVDQGLVAEKISSFKFYRTNGEEQLATPQVRITAKGLNRLHRDLAPSKEIAYANP